MGDRVRIRTKAGLDLSVRTRQLLLSAGVVCAMATAASAAPPILQAEKSDTATLAPIGPHWVLVQTEPGSMTIYDGDKGAIVGSVPVSDFLGNVAVAPDLKHFYVAETMWSEATHGTRIDLLEAYDEHTLNLEREVSLPPRALTVFKAENFTLSADGRSAYIFNLRPATSVTVVDLAAGKVQQSIDTPGCGLTYPWRQGGFSSLCGDGSLLDVALGKDGKPAISHTKPFFDANEDPVFESSIDDVKSGQALFISYTGKVYPAQLGAGSKIGTPWSLQTAAGQPAATTGVQSLAWRPGGVQVAGYHRPSHELYVLMHTGTHWTQKVPGSEVWVFDAVKHTLLRRIVLDKPAKGIAVSQDAAPQLYAVSGAGDLDVIDARTGKSLKTAKFDGGGPLVIAPAY